MRNDAASSAGAPTFHVPSLGEDFRRAMRLLGSEVAIVASGTGGALTGMTVTSLASLSVDPPAVSLAVARSASIHPVLTATGRFGVSGLGLAHRALADRFAGRDGSKGAERFTAGRWIGLDGGAPTLEDATFALTCTVASLVDWHSHTIVLAHVNGVRLRPAAGLSYRDGHYGRIEPIA